MKLALSFDDVLLQPSMFSEGSRENVSLATNIGGLSLKIPIIAANMKTICEDQMADAMSRLGGLGIIHRMCSIEEEAKFVKNVIDKRLMPKVGASIGVDEECLKRANACITAGADLICIDVAHAHQPKVLEVARKILDLTSETTLIIGNIATVEAVKYFINPLYKYSDRLVFKVGIGGGSVCTTRVQTGCGVPTFESVWNIASYRNNHSVDFAIIADGGIKNSGDIVKSLAAGADAVMIGRLLAGTNETPGAPVGNHKKVYAGSASFATKGVNTHIEGSSTFVPCIGPVEDIINSLCDGIRSGLSYCGVTNIKKLQETAQFIQVTSNGYRENLPHGVL